MSVVGPHRLAFVLSYYRLFEYKISGVLCQLVTQIKKVKEKHKKSATFWCKLHFIAFRLSVLWSAESIEIAMHQLFVVVVQVHSVALAVAPHLALRARPFVRPRAVAIFLKTSVPHLP